MNFKFFFVIFSLLLLSWSKELIIHPDLPIPKPDGLILRKAQIEVTSFSVDEDRVNYSYPGSIFSIDSSGNKIKFKQRQDYTALPVRIGTSVYSLGLSSYEMIPSLQGLQGYVNLLQQQTKGIGYTSVLYSGWSAFVDHNFLLSLEEDNDDLRKLLTLLSRDQDKNTTMNTTKFFRQGTSTFTVDMSLPRKTQLISVEESATMDDNTYYVSSVDYGYKFIMVADGAEEGAALGSALTRFFLEKKVSAEDAKILDVSNLYICLRTSASKEAIVEKASGTNQIIALFARLDKQLKEISFSYPIGFRLRSLKDLSAFKYVYTNQWYIRETKN